MIGAIEIDEVNKDLKNWFFIFLMIAKKPFSLKIRKVIFISTEIINTWGYLVFLSNKELNSLGIGALKVNNFLLTGWTIDNS